jgi:hypothetical protein
MIITDSSAAAGYDVEDECSLFDFVVLFSTGAAMGPAAQKLIISILSRERNIQENARFCSS